MQISHKIGTDFFVSKSDSLFQNASINVHKAAVAIPMSRQILMPHFASSAKTILRNLNFHACVKLLSPIHRSHLGLFLLLKTKHLKLMFDTFFYLYFISFLHFPFYVYYQHYAIYMCCIVRSITASCAYIWRRADINVIELQYDPNVSC